MGDPLNAWEGVRQIDWNKEFVGTGYIKLQRLEKSSVKLMTEFLDSI